MREACGLSQRPGEGPCKAITRDLQGSIGLRFFLAASMTPGGDVVPFDFQPTLGGLDINGNPLYPATRIIDSEHLASCSCEGVSNIQYGVVFLLGFR